MSRAFSRATAEQVISVVEAVVAKQLRADLDFIAEFTDLPKEQAGKALQLAVDLGFLRQSKAKGEFYHTVNPLSNFLMTPKSSQKAAILRVMLESYEPFVVFRRHLQASESPDAAAQRTRTLLQLDAHREEIKDTLINLATYSGALTSESGGRYATGSEEFDNPLEALAVNCAEMASAEQRVRSQLGQDASAMVSYPDVVQPLANALRYAVDGDARSAVLHAGNAIESFMDEFAGRNGVALTGATGINAKIDKARVANKIPGKLAFKGKYLGHIRNAADHGNDPEVSAAWQIRKATGLEYVFVACSFISTVVSVESGVYEI